MTIYRLFMKTQINGQFCAKNAKLGFHTPKKSLLRNITSIATVLLLGMLSTEVNAEQKYYVAPNGNDQNAGTSLEAPFQTLERAQQAVRNLKHSGELSEPVTIYIKGGTYTLTEPIRLTAEDSGDESCPITYTALPGEKVLLSGGEEISGWKHYKNNIWVTTLPEVQAGEWWFRQLYVNGELRGRARTPNKGVFEVKATTDTTTSLRSYQVPSDSFIFNEGDLNPKWKHPENGEAIIYHYWTDSHLPIQAIDGKTNRVSFGYSSGKVFRDGYHGDLARYVVENILETLDQPGEWVLERSTGKLYYMPMPNEDLTTAKVVAPKAEKLIVFDGNPKEGKFVEYITFRNLNMAYTNFNLPWGNCNDAQGSASVSACIDMTGARHCAIERCTMRDLGTFAVELFDGCTYNRFCGNQLSQLAAGGFRLRGTEPGSMPALRTGNNTISDNTIAYYGLTYPSAVGILIMHSDGNTIAHNLIHHGDYTGISVGWSWGYQRSAARNNLVEQNHIHDIGYNNLLSDMGGIYTLGLSPGTAVRNNLVHDVNANRYGGWGIYADEGSTSVLIENNIVYNTKYGTFNIHYAKDLTVRNNIFALGRLQQYSRSKQEEHTTAYFEGNIIYWTQGKLMVEEYKWNDISYKMSTNPYVPPIETNVTYVSDWNIFYNPNLTRDQLKFGGRSWAEWQALGHDLHSLYVDPMFVDAANHDFRLKADSPALKMGFQQIDMSQVGPRPEYCTNSCKCSAGTPTEIQICPEKTEPATANSTN